MIHTVYSSIHTHVSSLIPRMMCRIIMVLLRVMYDPHSLFIYSHTCLFIRMMCRTHMSLVSIHTHVSSLMMMCRIIMVLLRVMYDPHSLFIYSHTCL